MWSGVLPPGVDTLADDDTKLQAKAFFFFFGSLRSGTCMLCMQRLPGNIRHVSDHDELMMQRTT